MNKVYLLLGSNLKQPAKNLATAVTLISKKIGPVQQSSSMYQTAAWGNYDQPDFVNQVIVVDTNLAAETCIETALAIEQKMGRVRTQKNAPRIIDIDILYFNKDIIKLPNLVVPHPAIHLRRFVLIPLNELAPRFIHPVLKQTNSELLKICSDELDVKKI
ncbi:MAG: 2-amino-4-hydroxy-6-hydroxymethyldihydropteridine diphosphokinase [Chitinophagaceae bacterium]|nr:MAG: 2-amino-4-hydroxy-6-hydroxymethyldihydropteridine diphosphokinase [Chitinophagaceae bacterium]